MLRLGHLVVARGERLFLHGASGSGKSTLLGLIAGVLRADNGQIRLFGTDLGGLSGSGRDRFRADHIGFVFQLFNLLPYLDLVDNVLLPCRFSRVRRQRALARHPSLVAHAQALLQSLGLPPALHSQPVTRLSVGQQQRVAVARALSGAPELLICDEPTSALDAHTRSDFLQLLFDQQQHTGCTLLFVSHDHSLATGFDRCLDLVALNQCSGVQP